MTECAFVFIYILFVKYHVKPQINATVGEGETFPHPSQVILAGLVIKLNSHKTNQQEGKKTNLCAQRSQEWYLWSSFLDFLDKQ